MLPRGRGARIGLALGLLGALLSAPAPAVGQENFEIQVYGSETVPPGTKSLFHLHRESDEVAWVLALSLIHI